MHKRIGAAAAGLALSLSSSCVAPHYGDTWCMIAFDAVGTHPISGQQIEIRKTSITWTNGCQCLHQSDSDLVEDVELGAISPNLTYWNIRQRIHDIAVLNCEYHATAIMGLLDPTCDEVISPCSGIFRSGEATCALDTNMDSAWGGTASNDDALCETDDWGGGSESGSQLNGEGCRGHVMSPSYPSDANDAVVCAAGPDDCAVDEHFVKVINTDPSLIDDDPGSVQFVTGSLTGLKITSVPSGSLAEALNFQTNDVITAVDGFSVETLSDAVETFTRVAKERANQTFTITYKRPGPFGVQTKMKTVTIDDLSGYP